ncbi:MAG: class II aldolase/adducin family protein [Oligoflexia bacterium]|nr:class II aldolase/adducin family protein [Oligoflexia bacterium]
MTPLPTKPLHTETLRREIVAASHRLHQWGFVANHDGNLSARLDDLGETDLRMLCTPTAVSKGDVQPEWLIVADAQRQVLQGTRRSFSELALHIAAYRARPDIGVVIHAHPPTATGFAVAGVPIPHPFMAEPVVSLGATLPVIPYAPPGDPQILADIAAALHHADALVLDRHGVITVGGSFEQALLRMELVEHLARIALVAQQLGGARPLPPADVQALSAKGRPVSDPARARLSQDGPKDAPTALPPSPASGPRPDVASVVQDALSRYR